MAEPTYRVTTLGCRVNRADSLQLESDLRAKGLKRAGGGEAPDVWVVNTCAVTAEGMRKSRKAARRAASAAARVLVTGCGVDYDPSAWTGKRAMETFPNAAKSSMIGTALGGESESVPFREVDPGELVRVPLKVQDGCSRFCAYCIVPYLRPPPFSRCSREVVRQVEALCSCGTGEIILCGTDLGSYREPSSGEGLGRLVEEVSRACGDAWLRLSSIEFGDVDGTLVEHMNGGRLCEHLHLPTQSGSDEILARMGRGYTAGEFERAVSVLRGAVKGLAVSGDIMVGFPGETEEHHRETLEVVERTAFSRLHVFKYSPRPGTRACAMGDNVAPDVKDRRAAEVRHVARGSASRFHEGYVGRIIQVLVEGPVNTRPGTMFGRSRGFAGVVFPGSPELLGRKVRVEVTGAGSEWLEGRLVRGEE